MAEKREYPVHVRDFYISDPCVLASPDTGKYYIYARMFDPKKFPEVKRGATFYALESEDLIHWSRPILVFDKPDDFWAPLDYWAPECHYYNGKYYLISSFRAEGKYRRCEALVSDSPLGPFVPAGKPLTPEVWQCLDGTLYIDKKGDPWLVFCHEWLQVWDGQVCAIRVKEDLSESIGDPIVLFYASDAPWRSNIASTNPAYNDAFGKPTAGQVTDGCFLHRMKNGTLIMLWSNFGAGGYTIGYARSASGDIQGPWIQEPEPLWAMDGGHAMLFRTFGDNALMMAFHCNNSNKKMCICQMEEDGDKLRIINEITGNWYDTVAGDFVGRFGYRTPCTDEAGIVPYSFVKKRR